MEPKDNNYYMSVTERLCACIRDENLTSCLILWNMYNSMNGCFNAAKAYKVIIEEDVDVETKRLNIRASFEGVHEVQKKKCLKEKQDPRSM